MADKLRIMLVDDHYLVRMGLASIIALEPDIRDLYFENFAV